MSVQPLPTPSAPPVAGPYSPAVRAGDFVVLAGQVGIDGAGKLVHGGIEAQAGQVLANIAAVLGDIGAGWDDVARTTIGVAALPAGARVEIECWVYLPEVTEAEEPT